MKKQKKLNIGQVKPQKNKKIFWGIICLVLFVVTIFMTIESVTSSTELTQIGSQAHQASLEIEELSNRIVKNSSLTELEQKADITGFVKPTQIVYIAKPAEMAAYLP